MAAGQQLKFFRNRRNITVRDVEQASRRIADAKRDKSYQISNGWLTQLENGVSRATNIFKLFSLSVIYRVNLSELLRLYDIDVDNKEQYESVVNPNRTQLLPPGTSYDFGSPSVSTCLASMQPPPPTSLASIGDSTILYGHLGTSDFTMYPLIRPGALLEIDTSQNKLHSASRANEFDRPIYFVELRDEYACGWCELHGNQLLIIPHQSSPVGVRGYGYRREAEIIGRVVAYHTRCVDVKSQQVDRASG